ncbi:Disintegrin and metalloproteinase domain-containing protein 2, partial [Ophiophagus hannah]
MIYTYNPGGFVQPSTPEIQMFADINVTVVLSSLEFWTDSNKISTEGEADEILRRFLQWKNSYLVLRPHDLAFLFMFREKPNYVGAAFTGKLCLRNFDAAVALLLGFSLGMEYEDGKECKCPGHICIMNTNAMQSAPCLSNRPNLKLYSRKELPTGKPACGNGILEPGEKCDCGSIEFKPRNTICRQALDKNCDFPEYCNGSSAICPGNVYVQNGIDCASNTGFCYGGFCQSADLHCQEFFGSHLKCGKLICTYPYDTPYTKLNVPVLYMPVKNIVCVSLDLDHPDGTPDPMMVKEGTKCGLGKVCNNKRNCHCNPGWAPPDCRIKGNPMGGSIDSGLRYLDLGQSVLNMKLILSSLELWINKDKIPITGNADALLQQFLNWKNEHLTLRPHDTAFLFV